MFGGNTWGHLGDYLGILDFLGKAVCEKQKNKKKTATLNLTLRVADCFYVHLNRKWLIVSMCKSAFFIWQKYKTGKVRDYEYNEKANQNQVLLFQPDYFCLHRSTSDLVYEDDLMLRVPSGDILQVTV